MIVKQYGKVAGIAQKSFEGKDGETVEYNEVYIQTTTDDVYEVIKINSKSLGTESIGQFGDFEIDFSSDGKKPKLVAFTPK